jgi:hypothetical protein
VFERGAAGWSSFGRQERRAHEKFGLQAQHGDRLVRKRLAYAWHWLRSWSSSYVTAVSGRAVCSRATSIGFSPLPC